MTLALIKLPSILQRDSQSRSADASNGDDAAPTAAAFPVFGLRVKKTNGATTIHKDATT